MVVSSHVWLLCTGLYPNFQQFYSGVYITLTALYGIARSLYLSNLFPICMELAAPDYSPVTLFMLLNMVEGVGGLIAPYLICE